MLLDSVEVRGARFTGKAKKRPGVVVRSLTRMLPTITEPMVFAECSMLMQ